MPERAREPNIMRALDAAFQPLRYADAITGWEPGDPTHDTDGMPFVYRLPDGTIGESPEIKQPRPRAEQDRNETDE